MSLPELTANSRHASAPAAVSSSIGPTANLPSRSSPSPQPRLVRTQDDGPKIKVKKRIIACCDGTWQDGLSINERWKFTNVLRMSRAICHEDDRTNPPIQQIVFYQSGVGTANNLTSRIVDGATGFAVEDKVEEVYNFVSQNFSQGDEIFLFGFSRGAYTARMVAQFIGDIGILDRTDMDYFADIFKAFQKRGKTDDPKKIAELDAFLEPWTNPNSRGRQRACGSDPLAFSVKCVGVWDTVGAIGIPTDLPLPSEAIQLFGFNDRHLGSYVERAYHAMGLNELRNAFDVCKFEMTDEGRAKNQILKQMWFAGVHSDVGGGYEKHDLSDITLGWMAANVGDILALDLEYLVTRSENPSAPYGRQPPNNSRKGIFAITKSIQREVPRVTTPETCEFIHPSVLRQEDIQPEIITEIVEQNPNIVAKLLPLEEQIEKMWPIKDDGSFAAIPTTVSKAVANRTKDEFRVAENELKDNIAGKTATHRTREATGTSPEEELAVPTNSYEARPSRLRRVSDLIKRILTSESSEKNKSDDSAKNMSHNSEELANGIRPAADKYTN